MGNVTSFTPQEIADLERKPSDGIKAAIEATGNKEAVAAFEQYTGMFNQVHDTFITLSAYAMSAAYETGGADHLTEKLKKFFGPQHKAMLDSGYWSWPFKKRVEFSVNAVKCCHDCDIEIVGEDDEKLTFRMNPCGSGQRLWEAGIYEHDCSLCSPHPMTAGCDNFPIYCIHAPIGEICSIEFGSVAIYQQEYPEQVGPCSCLFHVYKKKEDIPESYYTRVGKKKPE